MQITPVAQFTAPLGGEEIELQQIVHDGGGMPLLRVRIRERKRFTIFDIDPATAGAWARRWRSGPRRSRARPPVLRSSDRSRRRSRVNRHAAA